MCPPLSLSLTDHELQAYEAYDSRMLRWHLGWWALTAVALGGLAVLTVLHPFLWPVPLLAGLSIVPAELRRK